MANVIDIDNLNIPELNVYISASEGQLLNRDKPEDGIFIAESPKVIERALDAGYKPISMLLEKKHIDGEAKDIISRCGNIDIYAGEFDLLTAITGFELTRGVLCAMHRKALPTVEEICFDKSRIAVLENVMNPTNVGAIIRSAAALGIEAVVLTPCCSNPLYRRSARVSMGTVFQIPWTIAGEDWIDTLKKSGFRLAAMALENDSVSICDSRLNACDKLAVVLGSEGYGLKESTIKNCDFTVKIPMSNNVDSLNVAAASAVAFWELTKNE